MTELVNTKILCVRVDRIGDLVLTLPADQAILHKSTWLINKGLGFICESALPPRRYKEISRNFSLSTFFELFKFLRAERFTHVIFFHSPWWMTLAACLAGVRFRSGRQSQWHSFLFLNKGFRQSRALGDKSELEYNFEIVKKSAQMFGWPASEEVSPLRLQPRSSFEIFHKFDLTKNNYLVVHPGMGGSALNWTTENYASLIYRESKSGKVVITGTTADAHWLAPVRRELKKYAAQQQNEFMNNIVWLDGKLNSEELLILLQGASGVVAPSTGVVHLSAALGTPTVGLYSPVKNQHPKRWGPKGLRVKTLIPEGEDPSCQSPDCMTKITVESVQSELKRLREDKSI